MEKAAIHRGAGRLPTDGSGLSYRGRWMEQARTVLPNCAAEYSGACLFAGSRLTLQVCGINQPGSPHRNPVVLIRGAADQTHLVILSMRSAVRPRETMRTELFNQPVEQSWHAWPSPSGCALTFDATGSSKIAGFFSLRFQLRIQISTRRRNLSAPQCILRPRKVSAWSDYPVGQGF